MQLIVWSDNPHGWPVGLELRHTSALSKRARLSPAWRKLSPGMQAIICDSHRRGSMTARHGHGASRIRSFHGQVFIAAVATEEIDARSARILLRYVGVSDGA